MLTRRQTFSLIPLALVAACATTNRIAIPQGTTLILVRHADRVGENLNDKGKARAKALVAALKGTTIDRIYSPGIKRNLDTAAPLAVDRGLKVIRHPTVNVAQGILPDSAGKTVIWIGNKTNLSDIWDAIAAPGEPPLGYGEMAIVTPGRFGRVKVERQRFGADLEG